MKENTYYARNREKLIANAKERYKKNKNDPNFREKNKNRVKEWAKNNKQKIKKYYSGWKNSDRPSVKLYKEKTERRRRYNESHKSLSFHIEKALEIIDFIDKYESYHCAMTKRANP